MIEVIHRFSKNFHVEVGGFRTGLEQISTIIRAAHAKVREMVHELAEDALAILSVFLGIQNVVMPKLVDEFRCEVKGSGAFLAAGKKPGTTVQSQYSHVFDGMIGRY